MEPRIGQLEAAIVTAASAHGSTEATYADLPYILHPLRVMAKVERYGIDHMIVAVLHDVLEDTQLDVGSLIRIGIPAQHIKAVEVLTRQRDHEEKPETYGTYMARVKVDPLTRRVKLADIKDHLDHGKTLTDSLRRRYERAQHYLWSA